VVPATTLETRDLRLVRAIAEAGGVTRAGRILALSQSAVSHQLKTLEDRLGVRLFERRARGVRMTEAGRRMLDLSREVLEPIARVEGELRGAARSATRTLRISSQCHTAYSWLPPVIVELASRHPEVVLRIVAEATSDPAAALAEGTIDLGFVIERPKARGVVVTSLFEDEIVAVLPSGHLLANRPFVEARDLAAEMLVLPDVSRAMRDHVVRRLMPKGGAFRRTMRVPLTDAIVELVRARHGVSLLPAWSVAGPASRHEVATVRLTRRGLRRVWYAVRRRGSPLEDAIGTLADLVRSKRRA
jgi:LysR family transcriptional regulator, regulator for metE and metH